MRRPRSCFVLIILALVRPDGQAERLFVVREEASQILFCVVVDFIDRNENSEKRDKQNTLLSSCKNTANSYKSTILQDNDHQAKFILTQERNEMTVSVIYRQNQMTYATNNINFSTIKKIGNVRKRQHQTEIECDHSLGNDKSHDLPSVLHAPPLSSLGIRLHLPVSMANL